MWPLAVIPSQEFCGTISKAAQTADSVWVVSRLEMGLIKSQNKLEFMNRIGEKLRILRQRHGYTMKQLADLLETDDGHISRIEHGKKRPSSDLILRISRLFGVTTDQLMKDELELD